MTVDIKTISTNVEKLFSKSIQKVEESFNMKFEDVYNSGFDRTTHDKLLTLSSGADFHLIGNQIDDNKSLVFEFDINEDKSLALLDLKKYDQDYIVYQMFFDEDGEVRLLFGNDNEEEESDLENIQQEIKTMLERVNNHSVSRKNRNRP